MADTSYTYSIASDTINGIVNTHRLEREVRASVITIAYSHADVAGDVLTLWFRAPLAGAEVVVLDGLLAAHTGQALPDPVNDDGIPLFALYGSDNHVKHVGRDDASDYVRSTHNFCDPTTWFHASTRISNEVLSNPSADGVTWVSVNGNWIDMTHGKVHVEDQWVAHQQAVNPGDPHGYAVVVTVDGAEQTQRAPFATSGGDYTVDYQTGTVTFASAPASAPQVSYSYETGSSFIMEPEAGKLLEVERSEGQFSADAEQRDTICIAFEIPNPDVPGTWIQLGVKRYKTQDQFIDEAMGAYPPIPAMNGARGYTQERRGFPLAYMSVRKLLSSMNLRLRVYLENDEPYGGERVTATFYAVSKPEV